MEKAKDIANYWDLQVGFNDDSGWSRVLVKEDIERYISAYIQFQLKKQLKSASQNQEYIPL